MIISIRGTHGSGKSTIVKYLIDNYPSEPILGLKKIEGYRITIPWLDKPLMVVGSYLTACGGCDGIQPYDLIWPRVQHYATLGHVVFEGALVSSSYGNIGRASVEYGEDFIFAFLDTPIEICLERIVARRIAKNNHKPLDPKNTIYKYNNINRSFIKIRDEFKRKIVVIDYRKSVTQILKILRQAEEGNNACPSS